MRGNINWELLRRLLQAGSRRIQDAPVRLMKHIVIDRIGIHLGIRQHRVNVTTGMGYSKLEYFLPIHIQRLFLRNMVIKGAISPARPCEQSTRIPLGK